MNSCELDKALKRYYRAVRRELAGPAKLRSETVRRLREGIADFLDERPDADIADITAHFGTPKQIALNVFSFLEPQDIRRCARNVRAGRASLAACLLFFAALCGAVSVPKIVAGYSAEGASSIFCSCILEKELPGLNVPLVIEIQSVHPLQEGQAEEGWQRLEPVLIKDLKAFGY